ncbi:unnamed protein product [Trichogramma brassicae]|uniref:Uncharacterized protein n=1 Tax=Trichogramma brassicae TaxID=86971 RepID=A0A6H5IAU0_9HYME|nr:unnamed protein product [Trichogramma brassicae]
MIVSLRRLRHIATSAPPPAQDTARANAADIDSISYYSISLVRQNPIPTLPIPSRVLLVAAVPWNLSLKSKIACRMHPDCPFDAAQQSSAAKKKVTLFQIRRPSFTQSVLGVQFHDRQGTASIQFVILYYQMLNDEQIVTLVYFTILCRNFTSAMCISRQNNTSRTKRSLTNQPVIQEVNYRMSA